MSAIERTSRRLKITDLHTFQTVVRARSMSKAAAWLNLSQSAISKSISDLEHIVGVRLLHRRPHRIEPTVYGNALLARTNVIFDEVRQGLKDIESLVDPNSGEVRIACDEPFAGLVAAAISRFRRRYPLVVCHMLQSPTTATLDFRELHERRADLMLARVTKPFPEKELHVDVLFHEKIYVVAGKRSKWAIRRDIDLADLVDEKWIFTPPSSLPTTLVEDGFRSHGLTMPSAAVVSQSVHLRNSLLLTGRYLTVLPGSFIRFNPMHEALKVLPVDLRSTPQPVAVVTQEHRTISALAKVFIEDLRKISKPLTEPRLSPSVIGS
jgi:DNA-binding transcriptional LysR family regulator